MNCNGLNCGFPAEEDSDYCRFCQAKRTTRQQEGPDDLVDCLRDIIHYDNDTDYAEEARLLVPRAADRIEELEKGITISLDSAEYTYNQLEDGGSIYRDHDKASKLLGELKSGLFGQHPGEQS